MTVVESNFCLKRLERRRVKLKCGILYQSRNSSWYSSF